MFFSAISDEASDDGIDDIDINFDEGDGEALIHQEMKPFHSEGADTPTDCQILPEEAAEDVLSDDENFGLRGLHFTFLTFLKYCKPITISNCIVNPLLNLLL